MRKAQMKASLVALSSSILFSTIISVNVQAQTSEHLLLVHGANFTADAWNGVRDQLKGKLNTVAVNLPGRQDNFVPSKVSLEISAAKLCSELALLEGDKTVAAHSQAGAVVNAALALCPDPSLTKIVYVTAVSPFNGESAFDLLSKQDESNYFSGISYNKDIGLLEISDSEGFANSFAPKANDSQRNWLKNHAVAEPSALGGHKMLLDEAQFKTIKKYYVFAEQDKVISLASQKKIADRLDLTASYTLDSGHLPMLTHATELAALLQKIAVE